MFCGVVDAPLIFVSVPSKMLEPSGLYALCYDETAGCNFAGDLTYMWGPWLPEMWVMGRVKEESCKSVSCRINYGNLRRCCSICGKVNYLGQYSRCKVCHTMKVPG